MGKGTECRETKNRNKVNKCVMIAKTKDYELSLRRGFIHVGGWGMCKNNTRKLVTKRIME